MPAKLDRPFEEGQPGEVYNHCYPEPKTGYKIAEELGLQHNIPYQIRSRYPEMFTECENGLMADVQPIIEAIKEDLGVEIAEFSEDEDFEEPLSSAEEELLKKFLENDWREAFGEAVETEIGATMIRQGPYGTLITLVGILVPWKRFYATVRRRIDMTGDSELVKRTGADVSTGIFPVVGETVYGGEEGEVVMHLLDTIDRLPNGVLEKLAKLPSSKVMKNTTEIELTKAKNTVKVLVGYIEELGED